MGKVKIKTNILFLTNVVMVSLAVILTSPPFLQSSIMTASLNCLATIERAKAARGTDFFSLGSVCWALCRSVLSLRAMKYSTASARYIGRGIGLSLIG